MPVIPGVTSSITTLSLDLAIPAVVQSASANLFLGHMILIVVDDYSNWPEVVQMKTTTAEQTICGTSHCTKNVQPYV